MHVYVHYSIVILGLPAGTVVITDKTVNGYVEEQHEMVSLNLLTAGWWLRV